MHAYNVRCQIIKTTENLKAAQRIHLEQEEENKTRSSRSSFFTGISDNQREINEEKEDIEDQKYFQEVIAKRTSKITMSIPPSENRKERLVEHKCANCGKRVYSVKSLNEHMEVCFFSQMTTFFSQIQDLFRHFYEKKLSKTNFQVQILSLIYNTNKTAKKIAKEIKMDLSVVSEEMKTVKKNQENNDEKNRNGIYSPDVGYNSGNN